MTGQLGDFMKELYLYIDESGNLGNGCGRYFLVCALEISKENQKTIHRRAGRVINRFKVKENISKNVELKGWQLNSRQREELIQKILYHNVKVRYIVLDLKQTTFLLTKADDKNACYNYLIQLLIKGIIDKNKNNLKLNLYLDNRTVKIGNRLSLQPYLYNKFVLEQLERKKRIKPYNFEINYLESKSCYLIQWTDIIANSLYKKYNNDNDIFYKIIKPYIVFESKFPSKKFGK